mgnify:CR=1 FL=1
METAFGKRLDRVRQASPLVHCISNLVTANDCANVVLAAGASPIMADAPEEGREITALSRALCLSLGTPNPRKADAMFLAGRKAAELGLPVVFDPVGVGASAYRQEIARKLLQDIPLTVLRCNASELQTLSGQSLVSRGVDAGKAPELETLLLLVNRPFETRLVTGEVYPVVAKQCNTTPIGVDQAIRTAVNQTWQEQNIPVYCALMGRSPAPHEPRPTSCEFLANVLMYVRIQMAECHY